MIVAFFLMLSSYKRIDKYFEDGYIKSVILKAFDPVLASRQEVVRISCHVILTVIRLNEMNRQQVLEFLISKVTLTIFGSKALPEYDSDSSGSRPCNLRGSYKPG
jgi:hypothetical protein